MNKAEFKTELDSFFNEFIEHQTLTWRETTGYVIQLASFGDYDHSCHVERANQRWLVENMGSFVTIVHGAYHSEWAIIEDKTITDLDWDNEEIQEQAQELIDVLRGLTNYPCIDNALLAEVEHEIICEGWEFWGERDFLAGIEKRFPDLDIENKDIEGAILRNVFESARERINEYWIIESGGSAYIDIEKVVSALTVEDINRLTPIEA